MGKIRMMHFLNQFFAGLGGEEKADVAVDYWQGTTGPGRRLQTLLGESTEIVVTAYCGDDYFATHRDEALQKVLQIARDNDVEIVAAGPAFASGRYGYACVEVCHHLSTNLGVTCVIALHNENPGLDTYREYKDRRVFAIPTAESVSGMEEALTKMSKPLSKLASGEDIGPAAEEGYIPHGVRVVEIAAKSGAERSVDMLLDRLSGRHCTTEIPIESLEEIPVAPPIADLSRACLALVSSAGVVPEGNPDGFKMLRNTQWKKYSIKDLHSMQEANWDVRHGGYTNVFMLENPNYGVPLDACRELEREGIFARLYPDFYTTSGIQALISAMAAIGKGIVADLKNEGVDAVIMVST